MELREPRKVDINGQSFPINFGTTALSYLSEQTSLSFKEVSTLGEDVPVHYMFKLIHSGLRNGHRLQHKFEGTPQTPFPLTWEDVTDLLDKDTDAIEKCMKIWTDSNVQERSDKKTEPEETEGKDKGGKQAEN